MAEVKLIVLLAGHLILTGLPGVGALLVAARYGVRRIEVLLAIALAASGSLAMLVFWAFYADPGLGKGVSYAVPFVSLAAISWAILTGRFDRRLLSEIAWPYALWGLGTYFLVFYGFMHGGSNVPLATGATRFTWTLPQDSLLPLYFANWFYAHGHTGTPIPYGGWLASDRPPLQIGYVLAQRPFAWDAKGLNYQLLGVALQQLWIVGLYALLSAARLGRITRGLTLGMVLVSDLAVVNGFYVWPKLLPVAMLLAAAALVLTPSWGQARRAWWGGALVGGLCALAMLGHGSSVFGVIPIAIVGAIRGLPSWRWLAVAIAVVAVLYLPWSAYQHYGDPPGNRLVKWMLAGDMGPDKQSTTQAIRRAYAKAGLSGTITNKERELFTMLGITRAGGPSSGPLISSAATQLVRGNLQAPLSAARILMFFNLLPTWGLLVIVPLLMAIRRRAGPGSEWRTALRWYLTVIVGCIAWGLILFGNLPTQAVLHEGSFFVPILGFAAAVAGTRAAFPRLAIWLVGINALISLAITVPSLTPPAGTSYSPLAITIALISLIGFVVVAFGPRDRSARYQPQPVLNPQLEHV